MPHPGPGTEQEPQSSELYQVQRRLPVHGHPLKNPGIDGFKHLMLKERQLLTRTVKP